MTRHGYRRSLDAAPKGAATNLPSDLREQHTFIVAAFRREQQALVDEWLPWLVDPEEAMRFIAALERSSA